jgi:aminoglycoside phosphotransferase (APT) family kinase protein
MNNQKMHDDEVAVDVALVDRLLRTQFPEWADLPIEPIQSSGTDNTIYRLGAEMCARLPRMLAATSSIDKEHKWLPKLAPLLPLAISMPLAKGTSGEGYPFDWSIFQWLEGETSTFERIAEPVQAAKELAQFIIALQRIDIEGAPLPGSHNSFRGEALAKRDAETRAAIASLHGMIDADAAIGAWEAALHAELWRDPPVWIHGDLQSGNLLFQDGRLSAVIDFGCLAVGDPACDLQVAWNLFSGESREVFRTELAFDEATWLRGRAWALSCGLIALPYYQHTNPSLADISRRAIKEVLADYSANT